MCTRFLDPPLLHYALCLHPATGVSLLLGHLLCLVPTAKLTVGGTGSFNAGSAARFDLFNTTVGSGFSQHVTDAGLWQLATIAGATRIAVDPTGLVVQDTSVGTAVDGTTSTNGSGVFGQSTGASGFGVYGDAPGGGYAIYANGNTG